MVEGCRVCKKCGQGSAIAKTVAAAGQAKEDTNLDKSLKRSAESLRIANNVWGSFSINVDPGPSAAASERRPCDGAPRAQRARAKQAEQTA